MAEFRTNTSKTFPQNHWMPLLIGQFKYQDNETAHGMTDQAAWNAQYQKAKDAITECCGLIDSPDFDSKCSMTPITSRPDMFRGSLQPPSKTITLTPKTIPMSIKDADSTIISLEPSETIEQDNLLSYTLNLKASITHDYIGQLRIILRKGGREDRNGRIDRDDDIPLESDVIVYDGSKSRTPAQRTLELNLSSDQPNSPLTPLTGGPVLGRWQLILQDTQAFEEGSLTNFQLTIQADE